MLTSVSCVSVADENNVGSLAGSNAGEPNSQTLLYDPCRAHMQHISETVNEKLRCKHIHAGHVEGFSGDEWKQNLQTNQERRARPHLTDETAPEDRREGCKGGRSRLIGKLKCRRAEMHDASKAFTTAADERVFKSFHRKLFSFSCLEVSSITFAASSALRALVVAL